MPFPVRLLFSGTTDTSGNASIAVATPSSTYIVATVSAQVAGNPNWSINVGTQTLTNGNGPQVTVGPILTFPGEKVTIVVANATPSSQVTGTIVGTQHDTADEAAANYQPSTNPVSTAVISPQIFLGSMSIPSSGLNTSQDFSLPPGTHSILINCHNGPNLSRLTVRGKTTNTNYLSINPRDIASPSSEWFMAFIGSNVDPVVTVIAAGDFLQTIYITAIMDTSATIAIPAYGSPAPPWQAARTYVAGSTAVTGGAYTNIVAQVGADSQLYLFWARFDIDAASGAVFAAGTDGATAGIFNINDNGKGPYIVGPLAAGVPMGQNSGVYVFTTSNSTVRYEIAYTAA